MKFFVYALSVFCLCSCNYFKFQEKESDGSEIVAIVNTEKLFKHEIVSILPQNIRKEDSLILVNSYIQNWAIKRILLENSKNNISEKTLNEIENLVADYKESLLINNYKEELIKQKLDTIISPKEYDQYYAVHKQNFKLNEHLVKIKFLQLDPNINNKNELIDLFKSNKEEDIELLEKQELSFKTYHFNDSVWVQLEKILLKLPFSKEKLLKKSKILQKQDSLGLYLATVKNVLPRNSIAPLSYIKSTIKQLILHNRKIQLIRDIEKILIEDATKNNNFKTY